MSREYWIAAAILACETSRVCYQKQKIDQFEEPKAEASEGHHRLYLLTLFQNNLDALRTKADQLNLL